MLRDAKSNNKKEINPQISRFANGSSIESNKAAEESVLEKWDTSQISTVYIAN